MVAKVWIQGTASLNPGLDGIDVQVNGGISFIDLLVSKVNYGKSNDR